MQKMVDACDACFTSHCNTVVLLTLQIVGLAQQPSIVFELVSSIGFALAAMLLLSCIAGYEHTILHWTGLQKSCEVHCLECHVQRSTCRNRAHTVLVARLLYWLPPCMDRVAAFDVTPSISVVYMEAMAWCPAPGGLQSCRKQIRKVWTIDRVIRNGRL